jgi:hypothetical protein
LRLLGPALPRPVAAALRERFPKRRIEVNG